MEVAAFTAIGNPANVIDRAVVSRLHFVGIFDDLINEITEVENETEFIGGRRALILKDHPAIAVELAFIDALAARVVQSDSAETGADAFATTCRNASSSATSSVSTRRPPDSNGRRVQRITLLGSGSPDATPSG